jgi:hypothetical protein
MAVKQINGAEQIAFQTGVPINQASVDLLAQTAAKTTTTLFAVVTAGQYLVTWNAKITTVASTGAATSTLGAVTIVYTDPDSTVQTITAPAVIAAGTIATTSTANTTATVLIGVPLLLNCKASTNITYAVAYASNTAAQMAYNFHAKCEAL